MNNQLLNIKNINLVKLSLLFIFIVMTFFCFIENKAYAQTVSYTVPYGTGGQCTSSNIINKIYPVNSQYDYWVVKYFRSVNGSSLLVSGTLPADISKNYDRIVPVGGENLCGDWYQNDDEGNHSLNGNRFTRIGVKWCDGPICPFDSPNSPWNQQETSVPGYNKNSSNTFRATDVKNDWAGDPNGSKWGVLAIFKMYKASQPQPSIPPTPSGLYCANNNTAIFFTGSTLATYYEIYRNNTYFGTTYTTSFAINCSNLPYQVRACNTQGCSGLSSAVTCQCAVTPSNCTQSSFLYEHSNYLGQEYSIGNYATNCANLPGWFNDKVSSLKVANGWYVTLFDHANCQGTSYTTNTSQTLVPLWMNDITSSYRLVCGAPAPPQPLPSAPSASVIQSCSSNCNQKNVTVNSWATNATYYKIFRWTHGTNYGWQHVGNSYGSYVDYNLPESGSYSYLVEACNPQGCTSSNPNYWNAGPITCPCSLGAINLSVNQNCDIPSNTLSWTISGTRPDNIMIYKFIRSDTGETLAGSPTIVSGNTNSYIDTSIDKKVGYRYILLATKSGYTSVTSNNVYLNQCQILSDREFSGIFISKQIDFENTDSELIISYDPFVVNNPPPGFADLLRPSWFELLP